MTDQVFLDCLTEYLSTESYIKLIRSYIPPTILNKVDLNGIEFKQTDKLENEGAEHIQQLLNKSNYQLRMYGSVQELCKLISCYRSTPSAHQQFKFDLTEPFSIRPLLCTGSNGEHYICKQDIFVYIQTYIFKKSEVISKTPFCRNFLASYIKAFEGCHCFTYEFVKFTDPIFNTIRNILNSYLQDQTNLVNRTDFPNQFVTYTHAEILDSFNKLIPLKWGDEMCKSLDQSLKRTFDIFPPTTMSKYYELMFAECYQAITALHTLLENNPILLMPNSKLPEQTKASNIVRVFDDEWHSFVPLDELEVLLGETEYTANEGVWETVSTEEAIDMLKRKFGENLEQVELIHVPIIRAKHRALFVRDSRNLPHKLAIDVFLELLYELILGMKVFQRVRQDELNSVEEMFSHFDKYFQTTRSNVHFIQFKGINEIEDYARNKFEYLSNRPAKDVRNAKKDGFTVQNLKNELVNLGLVNTFPDILDHAEIVYDTIVERTPVLTTTELFEAVVQCQFISFFKKFPKWTKFVHDQKGCDRVMYLECPCQKESTASEALAKLPDSIKSDWFIRLENLSDGSVAESSPKPEATQSSSTSKTKSTKKPVAPPVKSSPAPATPPKPKPTVKPTPNLPVEQPAQPSSSSPEPSGSVTEITKSQQRKENKKVAKEESQPDSTSCTKCERADKLCQETKKKLETCEEKLGAAEKEQSDWKKVKREMELELEKNKKKVVEMEKQMKNIKEQGDKKVEELKEQAEKLRISNKTEQEKVIAEREDLQKQLSEIMKINEECSNNFRDLSLLSSQKDLAIHKLQKELAAAREPPKERISVEMRRVLADLQDKSHSSAKLVVDTRMKVMRLINLPTREAVKQMARDEEAMFLLKHTEWEQAIKKNITIIQGNVHVTEQDLVPVPGTPGLSELLENELVIAEKKNESMGKECLVCREEKLQTQKLFKCPHCPTTFHVKCINDWIKYQPKCICPVCKENLN